MYIAAYRALEAGGTLPAYECGKRSCSRGVSRRANLFDEIPLVIEGVMNCHEPRPIESIDSVLEVDRWARVAAVEEIEKIAGSRRVLRRTLSADSLRGIRFRLLSPPFVSSNYVSIASRSALNSRSELDLD
jgi:hypothetical protein